jgi:WD40 repeat protein
MRATAAHAEGVAKEGQRRAQLQADIYAATAQLATKPEESLKSALAAADALRPGEDAQRGAVIGLLNSALQAPYPKLVIKAERTVRGAAVARAAKDGRFASLDDGAAHVWSADGRALASISACADAGSAGYRVALGDSGRFLGVVCGLSFAFVRDLDTGAQWTVKSTSPVRDMVLSETRGLAFTGHQDGTVRTWKITDGTPAAVPGPKTGSNVYRIAASANAEVLASSHGNGDIRCYTSAACKSFREADANPTVALSPSGRQLAVDHLTAIGLYEQGRRLAMLVGHTDSVEGLSYSPDGGMLASSSGDGSVRVWSTATGNSMLVLTGHAGSVLDVSFTPGGDLVTVSSDQTVRVWKLPPFLHAGAISSVVLSSDGREVITASDKVRRWKVESGALEATLASESWVYGLAATADGNRIAISKQRTNAWVLDRAKDTWFGPFVHGHNIISSRFTPDGKLLTTGWGGMVKEWDLDGGQKAIAEWQIGDDNLALDVSPSGLIAVGGETGRGTTSRVHLIRRGAAKPEAVPVVGFSRVEEVRFSPDGETLAVGDENGLVALWSLQARKQTVLTRHEKAIGGISFDGSGRRLAVGAWDGKTSVWERRDDGWREIARFSQVGPVNKVAFLPNGDLITAGENGLLLRWTLDLDKLAAAVRERLAATKVIEVPSPVALVTAKSSSPSASAR